MTRRTEGRSKSMLPVRLFCSTAQATRWLLLRKEKKRIKKEKREKKKKKEKKRNKKRSKHYMSTKTSYPELQPQASCCHWMTECSSPASLHGYGFECILHVLRFTWYMYRYMLYLTAFFSCFGTAQEKSGRHVIFVASSQLMRVAALYGDDVAALPFRSRHGYSRNSKTSKGGGESWREKRKRRKEANETSKKIETRTICNGQGAPCSCFASLPCSCPFLRLLLSLWCAYKLSGETSVAEA